MQLLVVAAIILSFKFYCKFYCSCDPSLKAMAFNGTCHTADLVCMLAELGLTKDSLV